MQLTFAEEAQNKAWFLSDSLAKKVVFSQRYATDTTPSIKFSNDEPFHYLQSKLKP